MLTQVRCAFFKNQISTYFRHILGSPRRRISAKTVKNPDPVFSKISKFGKNLKISWKFHKIYDFLKNYKSPKSDKSIFRFRKVKKHEKITNFWKIDKNHDFLNHDFLTIFRNFRYRWRKLKTTTLKNHDIFTHFLLFCFVKISMIFETAK